MGVDTEANGLPMLRANLNDILIFMAVVDAGSFVAGGLSMGLSRSAAGKAVTRLEDRLGARLLNRTTRTISLTDEGRLFHQHGLGVLARIDEAEASVAGHRALHKGTPRGTLRLTLPGAFGRLVVFPLLQQYLAAWPELQAEVSFTDRLADIVEEGFDLAIRIGVTAPDTRLVARTITTFEALLCASPDYLAERGAPADIDALATHDCLFFSSRARRQSWRLRQGKGAWIKARGRSRLRLDSAEALRDAALAGLGIAQLPDFLVADDVATGRLQRVLPRLDTDPVRIVALYPSKRLLEPRVRRFIDFIAGELGAERQGR